MLRTASVTDLRSGLSSLMERLAEGPIFVLKHNRPAAVLLEPDAYENILERIELLEDILDGRRAIEEYLEDGSTAVEAEEVFERLGV